MDDSEPPKPIWKNLPAELLPIITSLFTAEK
jgi:hypothetical protein